MKPFKHRSNEPFLADIYFSLVRNEKKNNNKKKKNTTNVAS